MTILRVKITKTAACATLLAGMLMLVLQSSASAAMAKQAWRVQVLALPSIFSPQHASTCVVGSSACDLYIVRAENVGGRASTGSVILSDSLPAGVKSTSVEGKPEPSCSTPGQTVASCTFTASVPVGGEVQMTILLKVAPGTAGPLVDTASVEGGGAEPATSSMIETPVSANGEARAPFSLEANTGEGPEFEVFGAGGERDVQAGDHPNIATFSAQLSTMISGAGSQEPSSPLRDLVFYLPLGFLGNPQIGQRCPIELISAGGGGRTDCPSASHVGEVALNIGTYITPEPLYNVTPQRGYAAQFAFEVNNVIVNVFVTVVHRDGTYMLRVTAPDIPRATTFSGVTTTLFGTLKEGERPVGAFLTNPGVCTSSSTLFSVEADSWSDPGHFVSASGVAYPSTSGMEALTGCGLLSFGPTLRSQPETTQADQPSGYTVKIQLPQAPEEYPALGIPPLRDVKLTLPEGVAVSPAAADGLGACQATGPEGINMEGPEAEAVGQEGFSRPVAGHCPASSQLGSVNIVSPLLSEELDGHLFLAQPQCGGAGQSACTEADAEDGTLFSLYLEAEAPNAGVVIKLAGKALVDPKTGQITAEFDENPQFPVSSVEVHLNGGPRAPLANPQSCGNFVTTSEILSWSGLDVTPTDGFSVPCPSYAAFAPSFDAGTISATAGSFSPFTLTLSRHDGEEDISSIATTLPEGLLAAVANVGRCPEPQAEQGDCPAASLIGSTSVLVGAGSHPFAVRGSVFFTGPYKGAPFGLSVVVPAVAGPFNLGLVVVRVALYINSKTAQVTAVSDSLPQIIDGVPLRTRQINVTLDHRDFTFNATDCAAQAITGGVASAQSASYAVRSPYAAGGCSKLGYSPKFALSTAGGKTTRKNGTNFDVTLTPRSGQANTSYVHTRLPKQLPVRLATLHLACLAAKFEADPASCPPESAVGRAKVTTPILAAPLQGPVYIVSHGGAGFPSLVMVLQGEGVTIDVEASTHVSKGGILESTFATVPDAPFSALHLVFPAGKYSLFSSGGKNLCGQKLAMGTQMIGQNNRHYDRDIRIGISSCVKRKPSHPTVKILTVRHKGDTVIVTVGTSQKGRLRITGRSLKAMNDDKLNAGKHLFWVKLVKRMASGGIHQRVTMLNVTLTVHKRVVRANYKIHL